MIYFDLSQPPNRKNFVTLHETAHGILPWQQNVHELIGDDDYTLNPDHNEEFEAEANYFAAATLFQHDRFIAEISKLGLGIDAAIHLSRHFGASIHATLRRYVDCSKKRCALLILENLDKSGSPFCTLRNYLASRNFEKTFGNILLPQQLNYSFPFVLDYAMGRKSKKGGTTLQTNNGAIEFTYQLFNNTYNAFVFLYPIGESKSSKTTFIIKDL